MRNRGERNRKIQREENRKGEKEGGREIAIPFLQASINDVHWLRWWWGVV